MSAAIDPLFSDRAGHARGCSICGGPNVVNIQVRISEVAENGAVKSVKRGGRFNSRGRSLCADHAVVVWPAVLSALEDAS